MYPPLWRVGGFSLPPPPTLEGVVRRDYRTALCRLRQLQPDRVAADDIDDLPLPTTPSPPPLNDQATRPTSLSISHFSPANHVQVTNTKLENVNVSSRPLDDRLLLGSGAKNRDESTSKFYSNIPIASVEDSRSEKACRCELFDSRVHSITEPSIECQGYPDGVKPNRYSDLSLRKPAETPNKSILVSHDDRITDSRASIKYFDQYTDRTVPEYTLVNKLQSKCQADKSGVHVNNCGTRETSLELEAISSSIKTASVACDYVGIRSPTVASSSEINRKQLFNACSDIEHAPDYAAKLHDNCRRTCIDSFNLRPSSTCDTLSSPAFKLGCEDKPGNHMCNRVKSVNLSIGEIHEATKRSTKPISPKFLDSWDSVNSNECLVRVNQPPSINKKLLNDSTSHPDVCVPSSSCCVPFTKEKRRETHSESNLFFLCSRTSIDGNLNSSNVSQQGHHQSGSSRYKSTTRDFLKQPNNSSADNQAESQHPTTTEDRLQQQHCPNLAYSQSSKCRIQQDVPRATGDAIGTKCGVSREGDHRNDRTLGNEESMCLISSPVAGSSNNSAKNKDLLEYSRESTMENLEQCSYRIAVQEKSSELAQNKSAVILSVNTIEDFGIGSDCALFACSDNNNCKEEAVSPVWTGGIYDVDDPNNIWLNDEDVDMAAGEAVMLGNCYS